MRESGSELDKGGTSLAPVVKTPCFHCRGSGSIPGRGTVNKILPAGGQKNKQKKSLELNKDKKTIYQLKKDYIKKVTN